MVKRMKNFALTDKIAVSPRAAARTRKLAGKGIQGIVKAVFLLGFCFVILYPILMMVSKAFMERGDISTTRSFLSHATSRFRISISPCG